MELSKRTHYLAQCIRDNTPNPIVSKTEINEGLTVETFQNGDMVVCSGGQRLVLDAGFGDVQALKNFLNPK